jgi:amino acid permease
MGSEKGIDVSPVRSDSDHIGKVGNDNKVVETKRGLSARHVQLMAIGGSIGTGLWVCEIAYGKRSSI